MSKTATPNGITTKAFDASSLLRPAALTAGQRVQVVLGKDDNVGVAEGETYIVTDAQDKRGNPQLIHADNGTVAFADPSTVFALLY